MSVSEPGPVELTSKHDFAPQAAIAGGPPAAAGTLQDQAQVRRRRAVDPAPAVLLLAALALPLVLAAGRSYLSFGVETDYLALFVPEAKRLLAAEPLLIAFHPPLYPAALALVWSVLGDWVRAGIAVSLLAALTAALTTWWLIDRLFGRAAALGALGALATSAPYLAQAAGASSDLFFLALWLGACALALAGLHHGRDATWLGLGLLIGLALLTRTNALPLLLLLVAPLLRPDAAVRRARAAALAFAALALPLCLWLKLAAATGSPPWPTSNHVNLAMTYFATAAVPVSNEAFVSVAGRFGDLREVLARDPARLLAVYLPDLLSLARDRLPQLIAFPLGLLALPGLLLLAAGRRSAGAGLIGLVTLGEVLLVNLKTFEARYWLFLLPWLGAGLGAMLAAVARALPATSTWRLGQASALGAAGLLALALALGAARAELRLGADELAEAVLAARALAGPGDLLVARKPHLAYYTGAGFVLLPDLQTADALRSWLCALPARGQILVYAGQTERAFRPALQPVLAAKHAPAASLTAAGEPLRGPKPLLAAKSPPEWTSKPPLASNSAPATSLAPEGEPVRTPKPPLRAKPTSEGTAKPPLAAISVPAARSAPAAVPERKAESMGEAKPPPWLERVAVGGAGNWTLHRRRDAGCISGVPGAPDTGS